MLTNMKHSRNTISTQIDNSLEMRKDHTIK